MFGVVGFQTLINADLDPTRPGTGTPTGPTDLVGLGRWARVRNGRAFVPLTCNSPQSCAGRLLLRRLAGRQARASAARGRRRRIYAATLLRKLATVCLKPSISGVCASKPIHSRALDTSR